LNFFFFGWDDVEVAKVHGTSSPTPHAEAAAWSLWAGKTLESSRVKEAQRGWEKT